MPTKADAEVCHLLRNLRNARALARSPLAGPFTGSDVESTAARVRDEISRIIDRWEIARQPKSQVRGWARRRLIIKRCDLDGAPHATVAKDIGICERQLYRERAIATQAIGEELRARRDTALVEAVAPNIADLQLWDADALIAVGDFARAERVLRAVETSGVNSGVRMRALHRLIDVYSENGDLAGADRAFADLRGIYAAAALGERLTSAMETAEMLGAHAVVEWNRLRATSVRRLCEQAITLCSPPAEAGDVQALAQCAQLWMLAGDERRESGKFDQSLHAFRQARWYSERAQRPDLQATAAMNLGYTSVTMQSGMSMARSENARSLEIARKHGLVRHAAAALGNLSVIAYLRGEIDAALDFGEKALALSEHNASAVDYAVLLTTTARIYAAKGDPSRAFEMTARARARSVQSPFVDLFAKTIEAEALLNVRRHAQALELARDVRREFDRAGSRRRIGTAMRVQAEALAGLGRKREASATIRDAVEQLEREGSAFHLAQGYEASARITGNRRHIAAAHDLRAILRG